MKVVLKSRADGAGVAIFADETVLWLRNCAEEAKEPFATVIQQAAEYLHDFWAEVIHTLPDESTAE